MMGACPLEPWHSPAWSGEVTGEVSDVYGPEVDWREGLTPPVTYPPGALQLLHILQLTSLAFVAWAFKNMQGGKRPPWGPPGKPGKYRPKHPAVRQPPPEVKPYRPDVEPYRGVPPPFVWPGPKVALAPAKVPVGKAVGKTSWVNLSKVWQVPVTPTEIYGVLDPKGKQGSLPPKLAYADMPDLPTVGITVPKPSPTLSVSLKK